MSEQEIKTLEGLRVLIIERCNRLDKDIGGVKKRLNNIEKEIHDLSNGKPDIAFRLSDLENSQKSSKENKKNRANWLIPLAAALLSAFLTHLAHYFLD